MLNIENTKVFNFEGAIRGARNPMNSWSKSDSVYDEWGNYILGPNDLRLAKQLCKAGPDHRKFVRQIFVSVDLTGPLYWWKEADTYKVATVANSCSTMHKISAKEFVREDFSMEHLVDDEEHMAAFKSSMDRTIADLNTARELYLETKDKKWWWQMIQLLPSSYNQKRTWTCNYETLRNIYHARKNHKLDEWHVFCAWIESLPYSDELIIGEEPKEETPDEWISVKTALPEMKPNEFGINRSKNVNVKYKDNLGRIMYGTDALVEGAWFNQWNGDIIAWAPIKKA